MVGVALAALVLGCLASPSLAQTDPAAPQWAAPTPAVLGWILGSWVETNVHAIHTDSIGPLDARCEGYLAPQQDLDWRVMARWQNVEHLRGDFALFKGGDSLWVARPGAGGSPDIDRITGMQVAVQPDRRSMRVALETEAWSGTSGARSLDIRLEQRPNQTLTALGLLARADGSDPKGYFRCGDARVAQQAFVETANAEEAHRKMLLDSMTFIERSAGMFGKRFGWILDPGRPNTELPFCSAPITLEGFRLHLLRPRPGGLIAYGSLNIPSALQRPEGLRMTSGSAEGEPNSVQVVVPFEYVAALDTIQVREVAVSFRGLEREDGAPLDPRTLEIRLLGPDSAMFATPLQADGDAVWVRPADYVPGFAEAVMQRELTMAVSICAPDGACLRTNPAMPTTPLGVAVHRAIRTRIADGLKGRCRPEPGTG